MSVWPISFWNPRILTLLYSRVQKWVSFVQISTALEVQFAPLFIKKIDKLNNTKKASFSFPWQNCTYGEKKEIKIVDWQQRSINFLCVSQLIFFLLKNFGTDWNSIDTFSQTWGISKLWKISISFFWVSVDNYLWR